jgi:hypothetical protein
MAAHKAEGPLKLPAGKIVVASETEVQPYHIRRTARGERGKTFKCGYGMSCPYVVESPYSRAYGSVVETYQMFFFLHERKIRSESQIKSGLFILQIFQAFPEPFSASEKKF